MGCSNDKFEAEVKKEVFAYINILSISSEQKDSLKVIIIEDLRKKSAAFQSYHYDYKEDDKDKVVKEYKEMIDGKVKGGVAQKKEEEKKEENKEEEKKEEKKE